VVYGREVDGTVTTFGTTGYTYDRVFVLYDRLTSTVWYPLDDEAFVGIGGPRRDARIPILAQPEVVTLAEWLKLHPDSEVLLEDAPPEGGPADPRAASLARPEPAL